MKTDWGYPWAVGVACLLSACGRPPPPAAQPEPGCGRAAPAEAARAAVAEPASPSLWLRLNLPSFRLQVKEGARLVASYPVAVGQADYPTPVGEFLVDRIVWNPWWVPPRAAWAANDTVTPPGPGNPMGRVKLLFSRPDYYVHGTSDDASLGKAVSHGCIRLANTDALALARLLWRQGGDSLGSSPELPAGPLVSRAADLNRPVRLEITYDVALLRGDSLLVFPDIYRHYGPALADRVYQVLRDAGPAPGEVDSAAVAGLLRRGADHPAAAALAALYRHD